MLKKFLVTIGLLASLTTKTYKTEAIITFCDNNYGTVIAKDSTGNLYAFDGCMTEDQKVILTLDSNGTLDREDDLIINVTIKGE